MRRPSIRFVGFAQLTSRARVIFISAFSKREEAERAIGICNNPPGLSQEQMDAINTHLDMPGDPAEGLIFHASGTIEGGWPHERVSRPSARVFTRNP